MTPQQPLGSFASDNTAGASPAVLEAIARANEGAVLAYGDDPWTRQATAAMDDLLGLPVETLLCWGGTGANVVGLASILQPHQCIVSVDSAHIVVDECGAPVRFSGSSIQTVPHVDGKLVPAALETFAGWIGVEHHPQPAVVSISQATEMGTCYSLDELAAICDAAHRHGLLVHLDGARLANAVAALGCSADEMIVGTGVDVMTFGMTKNGALFGEAVVFVRPELAERARFVRKQAGQLVSKSRFVAVQLLALLDGDLWLRHAGHANDMASRLADKVRGAKGIDLLRDPQVNSVFVRLPPERIRALQDWSFFWEWDSSYGLVRWMTSWASTPEDVDVFADGAAGMLAPK
ncbi:MAG: low specificity L-threonine aldolase [Microthrixaceae bacterium]